MSLAKRRWGGVWARSRPRNTASAICPAPRKAIVGSSCIARSRSSPGLALAPERGGAGERQYPHYSDPPRSKPCRHGATLASPRPAAEEPRRALGELLHVAGLEELARVGRPRRRHGRAQKAKDARDALLRHVQLAVEAGRAVELVRLLQHLGVALSAVLLDHLQRQRLVGVVALDPLAVRLEERDQDGLERRQAGAAGGDADVLVGHVVEVDQLGEARLLGGEVRRRRQDGGRELAGEERRQQLVRRADVQDLNVGGLEPELRERDLGAERHRR